MDVFHHIPLRLQTFMFNLTPPPLFLHLAESSATVLQICDLYESHIIRSVSALMSTRAFARFGPLLLRLLQGEVLDTSGRAGRHCNQL